MSKKDGDIIQYQQIDMNENEYEVGIDLASGRDYSVAQCPVCKRWQTLESIKICKGFCVYKDCSFKFNITTASSRPADAGG